MPSATTLFEYDTDTSEATPAERAALRRLQAPGGAEFLSLAVRPDGAVVFRATQHVGLLRLAGRTIQVLPKIYRDDAAEPVRRATAARNLLYLLEIAGDLPTRAHDHANLFAEKADWFEVLTHLFARNLRDEWSRGPWRTYHRVEDDASPALRGAWRLTEQLRRPERRHLFAVAYDEFTADNPLNRTLRYTVERLRTITRDPGNRRLLNDLRQRMDDVPCPPRVTAAEAAAITLTRQNARFSPLLKLAQLCLSGRSVQLAGGRDDSFAFMFDMNRLFEALVGQVIETDLWSCWEERGWTVKRQRSDKCLLIDELDRLRLRLRPDICFLAEGRTPAIIDTKYKQLDNAALSDADAYQLFAYAAKYACGRVILIYPGSEQTRRFRDQFDAKPWLEVRSLNLHADFSQPGRRAALAASLANMFNDGAEQKANERHGN